VTVAPEAITVRPMKRVLVAIATLTILAACGSAADPAAPPADAAAPDAPLREATQTITFDENGFSEQVAFEVPPSTRSIAVVVEGEETKLHALAAFAMADGVERVGLDTTTSFASAMQEAYFTEETGHMPGDLHQSIRLGTFTHVYPFAPEQSVVPGKAVLRVVSDAPSASATVRIFMPEDDGAHVLHLNLVRVSESASFEGDPAFVAEVRRIFAQAEIDVVVDQVDQLRGSGLDAITTFTEPQEAPDSQSAKLARMVGPKTRSNALNVMVVDSLVAGVAGLSLGVPGPPTPESYYYGVVIADAPASSLGRVVAHEVAHFLGLQHIVNRGVSGTVYEDPIPDTEPGTPNLMERGTQLTLGQASVLRRSPLLTTD
jgi:predicted small lipoprotein YifL